MSKNKMKVKIKVKHSIVLMLMLVITSAYSDVGSSDDKLSVIVTPPSNYNAKDTVHMVGNFNNWALVGNEATLLNYTEGKLVAELTNTQQDMFFTFVRNSDWKSMPSSETGNTICTFVHPKNANIAKVGITIPAWKDQEPTKVAAKTITGNVKIIKDFAMPQLNRVTDISIYLPPSYSLNTKQQYPVLYMLDGQNVFDESTANSNEWQVDESLETLITKGEVKELIVVAIANGPRRWNEYNPWDYKNWDTQAMETGEGDKTITFIKDALKPFIDKNYRTQVESTSTGLAGSSLAGLMALYGAMEYSDIFGFVAAFSPSLAIENKTGNNVLFEALKTKKEMGKVKIYVDMGKMEYDTYKEVELLQQHLFESGVPTKNFKLVKDDLGRHCELDWSKRFPGAITWLSNK